MAVGSSSEGAVCTHPPVGVLQLHARPPGSWSLSTARAPSTALPPRGCLQNPPHHVHLSLGQPQGVPDLQECQGTDAASSSSVPPALWFLQLCMEPLRSVPGGDTACPAPDLCGVTGRDPSCHRLGSAQQRQELPTGSTPQARYPQTRPAPEIRLTRAVRGRCRAASLRGAAPRRKPWLCSGSECLQHKATRSGPQEPRAPAGFSAVPEAPFSSAAAALGAGPRFALPHTAAPAATHSQGSSDTGQRVLPGHKVQELELEQTSSEQRVTHAPEPALPAHALEPLQA